MQELVPPSSKALNDALNISEELLTDIELSRLPLANIALKGSRLARLLNDFDYQRISSTRVADTQIPQKASHLTFGPY